jgi:hypothetical protein
VIAFLRRAATLDRLASCPLLDVLSEPDGTHFEFSSRTREVGSLDITASGALADAEKIRDLSEAHDVE